MQQGYELGTGAAAGGRPAVPSADGSPFGQQLHSDGTLQSAPGAVHAQSASLSTAKVSGLPGASGAVSVAQPAHSGLSGRTHVPLRQPGQQQRRGMPASSSRARPRSAALRLGGTAAAPSGAAAVGLHGLSQDIRQLPYRHQLQPQPGVAPQQQRQQQSVHSMQAPVFSGADTAEDMHTATGVTSWTAACQHLQMPMTVATQACMHIGSRRRGALRGVQTVTLQTWPRALVECRTASRTTSSTSGSAK